jgi:hypothetical protein
MANDGSSSNWSAGRDQTIGILDHRCTLKKPQTHVNIALFLFKTQSGLYQTFDTVVP